MAEDDLTKEELVAELDGRYQPKHVTEATKKNSKTTNIIIVIAVIVLAGMVLFYGDIDLPQLFEEWTEGEPVVSEPLEPAVLHLYMFSDLVSNDSVNVELWLINLGDETATDIEIYIRVRSQNGSVLLSDEVYPTILILRGNETCSAVYSVPIMPSDTSVTHTIEIAWVGGRVSYPLTTTI